MLAAVFAGWLGCFLAYKTAFALDRFLLYSFCVFLALYVAHLKDTYMDFFVRKEYELGYQSRFKDAGGILEKRELLLAILFSSLLFLVISLYLGAVSSFLFTLIALVAWLIALVYVPYLDKHWFTVSISYPAGVALAVLGGYVLQAGVIDLGSVSLCLAVWWLLIGVKIVDDLPDIEGDRTLSKKTIPVVIGFKEAKNVAYVFISLGLILACLTACLRVIPFSVTCSVGVSIPVFAYSWRFDPRKGIMVLIAGSYVLMLLTVILLVIA